MRQLGHYLWATILWSGVRSFWQSKGRAIKLVDRTGGSESSHSSGSGTATRVQQDRQAHHGQYVT